MTSEERLSKKIGLLDTLIAEVETAKGIECKAEVPPTPHEARMMILGILVWRIQWKRQIRRLFMCF